MVSDEDKLYTQFRYSNFTFYEIFDLIPHDLFVFNTIMRNFIKNQLLYISLQPKTYGDLFESVFSNEYSIIEKFPSNLKMYQNPNI